jgi:uncharacterized membrane protein (DUF485 family)
MMHSHANAIENENESVIRKRQRLGVVLLTVFSVAYGGFIGLCMFAFEWFSKTQVSGIPLTVGYGVALIILSLLMALLYGALSDAIERASVKSNSSASPK